MAGADLHRFGRRASVFGLCLFLISCSTLPLTIRPVNPPVAPADFLGITDLPEAYGSDQIRILFIHGIGEHTACDPDTLLRHLSKALNVAIELAVHDPTRHELRNSRAGSCAGSGTQRARYGIAVSL